MCYSTSLEMAQNNYNGLNLAFFLQNYFSRYNRYVKSFGHKANNCFQELLFLDEDPDGERSNHE